MQVVLAGETRFALQRACERATQPQLREYVNKNDLHLNASRFGRGDAIRLTASLRACNATVLREYVNK